jgi:Arm DNA-binding domain
MPDISTDREVKAAKTAGETPVEFTVKGAPGLRLRVTPRGFKSWSLLYTRSNDSKRCRIRLGEYPAMGLADAKRKVTELRARIQDGEDPAAAKQEARTAITLGELAASYLERHAKAKKRSWRPSSAKGCRKAFSTRRRPKNNRS